VGARQGCSSVLFFEARKKKDLYVWLARAPGGPSVKFYVTNGAAGLLTGSLAGADVTARLDASAGF